MNVGVVLPPPNQYEGGYNEKGKGLNLAEMCFKADRKSIAWTRIFPNGDELEPYEEGLKLHEAVFDELITYHIEPYLILSHDETPLKLFETHQTIWGGIKQKSGGPFGSPLSFCNMTCDFSSCQSS